MTPPKAKKIPHILEAHGHSRTDNYYWLREREDHEVIDYLNAENAYTQAMMAGTEELQQELFEEMKGRIKEDENSVPFFEKGYWYYMRMEEGKEYAIFCRKKGDMQADEEILLDVNVLAEGKDYCSIPSGFNVSLNGNLLVYAEDYISRRIYTLKIKNLDTGKLLEDEIKTTNGNVVWANDNQTLFYARKDEETLRAFQIWRHRLGTDNEQDTLVFEEKDDTFRCGISKTKSEKYLVISSSSTLTDEARILEAGQPEGDFRIFLERKRKHEYSIEHAGEYFYIRTNWEAKNFRLMRCKAEVGQVDFSKKKWEEVIPHRTEVFFENLEVFKDYLAISERENALQHIKIINRKTGESHELPFKEDAYSTGLGYNPEYDSKQLRFHYQSMTTPSSTYEYDLQNRTQKLLKEQAVLGGFDRKNYRTKRLWAEARDGVKVPMSIVYHEGTKHDGTAPLLLYGYGSYGYSIDPYFSANRLSLLDRGFVFVIAHIRGGEDLGQHWYEDGKLLKKKNTFTDFIDCGKYLVSEKYCAANKLYAMGGSAGGLLMGAIINMEPQMWQGVVAAVPFVDVVTTMLDDSIPLTTGEYDEWGNPNVKKYYEYILSYSPYDQVEAKSYPNLLITTGLHDSQVQYWEPAKWIAKLRELKTDSNLLMMHTDMDTGHGGASGRFAALKEIALDYAFLLKLDGE